MKVQHRNPKPYATRILNTSLRILTQLKVLLTRMDDMTSPRLTNTWEVLERAHFSSCNPWLSGDMVVLREVAYPTLWKRNIMASKVFREGIYQLPGNCTYVSNIWSTFWGDVQFFWGHTLLNQKHNFISFLAHKVTRKGEHWSYLAESRNSESNKTPKRHQPI